MPGFRIDVADLLSHPSAHRDVEISDELEDLAGIAARVQGPVEVRLALERITDGIVARGTVTTHWVAECSNCLRDLECTLSVHVDELFEPDPVEGETYPIEGHELNLEQLVRDSVLLELPLAPHCDEPCAPPSSDQTDDESIDPRWAALSELEL
jgi:uncharacterized protein